MATAVASHLPSNEFPGSYVSWKGRTLYQVVSTLQRNSNPNTRLPSFFHANPITKYYRREIASNTTDTCNQRTSLRMTGVMDTPGGTLVYSTATAAAAANGVLATLDPFTPITQETTSGCNSCNNNADNCLTTQTDSSNVCFSSQYNARRRCRSAGMVQKKFIAQDNNDNSYFTDTQQYLTSRNRKISQNQYVFIRQGNSVATPGTNASTANVYSPSGLSHCPKFRIAAGLANNYLRYIWLDGTTNTATIPDGYYDIADFNNAFSNVMIANKHYYINNSNGGFTTLIRFSYNLSSGVVELDILPTLSGNSSYSKPAGAWAADTQNAPQVIVPNTGIVKGLGFGAATYGTSSSLVTQVLFAQSKGGLTPNYTQLYYKPSNSEFATQGSVSSSSRVVRLRYNVIQRAAALTTTALGAAVGNALAYGVPVPDYGMTLKDKLGTSYTATPVVQLYSDGLGINRCRPWIFRKR